MKHITGGNPRNFRALQHILPVILLICSLAFTIIPPPDPAYAVSTIERVSENSTGAGGNNDSSYASISDDGRYAAFASKATNLAAGDTNGVQDIFVHDRNSGATSRVSVTSAGAQVNGESSAPAISGDGRYVAFASKATNLVDGDTNNSQDIFVRDRTLNTTTRVSVDSAGAQVNGESSAPAISGDGRYVAFASKATNLVDGDTNSLQDIFVRDRTLNTTTRVSVTSGGGQVCDVSEDPMLSFNPDPKISGDGRYVVFSSSADNLTAGDTNHCADIFVRDCVGNTTTRVSIATGGAQGGGHSYRPGISGDGHYVAFTSRADNLTASDINGSFPDVFVRDCVDNITTMVSIATGGAQANLDSVSGSISGDGRYVAFHSLADNLIISGDTNGVWDIFVRDRTLNTTARLSVSDNGTQGNGQSYNSDISSDGRYVVFESGASNLVPGDTNGFNDVFLVDRSACPRPGAPTLSSPAGGACVSGTLGNFNWAAGTGSPTKYVLQVSANPAFTGANIYYAQVNATSQLVTVLPNNGSVLYWRVLPGNAACGWGAWSARRAFYNGKPGSPTLSTPAAGAHVASTSVTFTWAAGTGTPANYFLQISTSPTWAGPNFHNAMVSGTSHLVTGFPNDGTVYYWRVTAGNTCGWSPWSARRAVVNGP